MNRPRTTFSFSSTSRILASYYRYKLSALNLINFHKIEFETNQGRRAARHPTPSWEEVYNCIPICNTFLMSFKTSICLWGGIWVASSSSLFIWLTLFRSRRREIRGASMPSAKTCTLIVCWAIANRCYPWPVQTYVNDERLIISSLQNQIYEEVMIWPK